MGNAQLEHAVRVDAAGERAVAGCDTHRHRFAGDGGSVQTADALDHHAVKRDTVARTDEYDVIDLRIGSGDDLRTAVGQDTVDRFRSEVDRLHNLAARTFDRAVLKIFANAVEQHYADRLIGRADRPCADGCQRHEEVFVKYAALADVAHSSQQDAPAEQEVRRKHGDHLRHAGQHQLTKQEQSRADEQFGQCVTAVFLLVLFGCHDLGCAFDRGADFADAGQQCVRIITGHAQLTGLKYQCAVMYAVQAADLVLHFCCTVCTAEVLQCVNTLLTVFVGAMRCGMMLFVVVVLVAAVASLVVVMMVLVAAVASLVVVMMVLVATVASFVVVMMVLVAAVASFVVVMMVLVAAVASFVVVMMVLVVAATR